MYISYEDSYVYDSLYGIKKAKNTKDYGKIYQNDILGPSCDAELKLTSAYIANVFKRDLNTSESVDKVSIYTNQEQTCKVLINPANSNKSVNDLKEVKLKDGDTVAIPDDASNGGRALKVLESAGIIEIDPDAGANPTVSDITNYKVQVDITELGASTIPSVIPDFTIAVVNGNYALDYGIDPSTAIFKESEYDDDSYFCLIAVKSGNADDPVYQEIVKLFQSEETKQIFEDKFGGYFVPAWEAKTK